MRVYNIATSLIFVLTSHTSFAKVYTFKSMPIEIPNVGPANPSFLYVEGLGGKVINVEVTLNGFDHKMGSELSLAVSNPDGFTTSLFSSVSCKYINNKITFSDSAQTNMKSKCNSTVGVPEGRYLPAETGNSNRYTFTIPIAPIKPYFTKLNELIQDEMNGRWILWVEDFSSGDGGKIANWELRIQTNESEKSAPVVKVKELLPRR